MRNISVIIITVTIIIIGAFFIFNERNNSNKIDFQLVDESMYQDETLKTTASSFNLAYQWLISNFREKGIFVYQYFPEKNEMSTKNNMIRQLMGSRLLAELALEDRDLKKNAQKES